ncbi:hypothetical protein ACJJTC_018543 [Scirpophaga incertulas]
MWTCRSARRSSLWEGKAKCSAVMKRKQVKLDEQKAMKVTAKKSKMYKKGECMKYMTIEVHPSLLGAWYMGDLQREATAKHTHVKAVSSMCDPSLVIFTRSREGAFAAPEQSTHGLYIMEASSVGEYVKNHTLSDHMKSIVDMSGCQLTLVVFGAKDYFKSTRKTTASKGTLMTEIDLMMALVDLLVSVECDNHLLDSSNDLALFIIQFTKAIAEAPFKKSQTMFDELAEFYMRGDKKTSVPIDSDGNGASQVWQQMLSVLPHSSLEIARAISGKYTGPANLAQVIKRINFKSLLDIKTN